MTPILKDKIAHAKAALAADPMGLLAGDIHASAQIQTISIDNRWQLFGDLLAEADGGRFGSIDIWSHTEYESKQYASIDFPGGQERWLIIGQLLYEPIALEAGTGRLCLFRRDGNKNGEDLGAFDAFFTDVVFGARYAEIVSDGDQDEWWSILSAAGLR